MLHCSVLDTLFHKQLLVEVFVPSLVTRLSPPPVFDRLQYANTEEGRHGRFGHVRNTSGRQRLDALEAGPIVIVSTHPRHQTMSGIDVAMQTLWHYPPMCLSSIYLTSHV